MKVENGRIIKGNVKLIEYGNLSGEVDNYFVQIGVAGVYCSKQELDDLFTALNYYKNIDALSECELQFK